MSRVRHNAKSIENRYNSLKHFTQPTKGRPYREEKKRNSLSTCRREKKLEISKELSCDYRTIKRFVINVNHKRKRNDKGVQKKLSRCKVSAIK
jgi:hypothetical protein